MERLNDEVQPPFGEEAQLGDVGVVDGSILVLVPRAPAAGPSATCHAGGRGRSVWNDARSCPRRLNSATRTMNPLEKAATN